MYRFQSVSQSSFVANAGTSVLKIVIVSRDMPNEGTTE